MTVYTNISYTCAQVGVWKISLPNIFLDSLFYLSFCFSFDDSQLLLVLFNAGRLSLIVFYAYMNMQNVYLALSWLRVDVSSKFVFEGVASYQRILFIYRKERMGGLLHQHDYNEISRKLKRRIKYENEFNDNL